MFSFRTAAASLALLTYAFLQGVATDDVGEEKIAYNTTEKGISVKPDVNALVPSLTDTEHLSNSTKPENSQMSIGKHPLATAGTNVTEIFNGTKATPVLSEQSKLENVTGQESTYLGSQNKNTTSVPSQKFIAMEGGDVVVQPSLDTPVKQFVSEGGPVVMSSSKSSLDIPIPEETGNIHRSQISARKGVNPQDFESEYPTSTEQLHEATVGNNDHNKTNTSENSAANVTGKHTSVAPNSTITTLVTSSTVITTPVALSNQSSSVLPVVHKKPLSTEHKVLPGYKSSSSQTNYVIPAVGAIFAVPLIVILGMYFYKKGSECWERRHYRRMDFLIDGMYND